ncbi:HTTM domain-containing protein [Halostagnicola bangensis]
MTADRSPVSNWVSGGSGIISAIQSRGGRHLGIDPRALAAFRIALGIVILLDLLLLRVPGTVPFYTDAGVLPRSALAEVYPAFTSASIHALSGSMWVQAVLFAVAGLFAVSLSLGYRTRLATFVSFVLLASLQTRNPYVLNGGDTILTSFLFLGLFLPLGTRWSIDAQRTARRRSREVTGNRERAGTGETEDGVTGDAAQVVSVATVTILAHIVLIYTTNAVFKFQSEAWMNGIAVRRTMHLEQFVVLLGPYLSDLSTVLTAVNWLWIATLSAAPLLILCSGKLRTAVVLAFICTHLGMAATMRLGVFPFVLITGLLLFLPPEIWESIERSRARDALERIETSIRATLPRGSPLETRSIPSITVPSATRRIGGICASGFLVVVLLTLVFWQTAQVGLVDSPAPELEEDMDDVGWTFFAPSPPDASSGYVAEAKLESGETVDLTHGGEATLDRPPNPAETFPTTLWKRYGTDMSHADESQYEPVLEYLCDRSEHEIAELTIYYLEQPVGPDGPVDDPEALERITGTC